MSFQLMVGFAFHFLAFITLHRLFPAAASFAGNGSLREGERKTKDSWEEALKISQLIINKRRLDIIRGHCCGLDRARKGLGKGAGGNWRIDRIWLNREAKRRKRGEHQEKQFYWILLKRWKNFKIHLWFIFTCLTMQSWAKY